MTPDERDSTTESTYESSDNIVERLERGILSRRTFLAGVGIGSIGGVGGTIGLSRSEPGFQSLATVAGGAKAPLDTRYYLPAVDATNSGLIVGVNFEFTDGNGELFINLDGIEVRHDLQRGLVEAMETATKLTGDPLKNTATHVSFEPPDANRIALRGKSWESGLTVALVASLRQQSLSSETLITGIVDDEGALLSVGNIQAKARAAQAFGATQLIVPNDDDPDMTVQGLRVISVQSISDALERII